MPFHEVRNYSVRLQVLSQELNTLNNNEHDELRILGIKDKKTKTENPCIYLPQILELSTSVLLYT